MNLPRVSRQGLADRIGEHRELRRNNSTNAVKGNGAVLATDRSGGDFKSASALALAGRAMDALLVRATRLSEKTRVGCHAPRFLPALKIHFTSFRNGVTKH